MSDTLERATEMDAPLEQLKQKMEAEPATPRRGSVSGALSLLLVLALGAGVGAGAYWLWPQWQQLQQQSQTLSQQLQQLEAQNRQLQDNQQQAQQQWLTGQQQQLTALEQRLAQQQQQLLNQTQSQVQALRQLVQERDSAPPRHWRLAEADYLLKLAAQKVWLEQDAASAIALLQSADDKLAELDDASLLPVRQAIAHDKQQLAALPATDHSLLQVRLVQLRQQVMQLPLKLQAPAAAQQAPEATLANWQQTLAYHWHNTWRGLFNPRAAMPEDYFDLNQSQQLMLRIHLQQQIQLAQQAVMTQQAELYRLALQQATDQLQRYFSAGDTAVQQFSQSLTELAAADVSAPVLSALQSPAMLQQYQQQLAGEAL